MSRLLSTENLNIYSTQPYRAYQTDKKILIAKYSHQPGTMFVFKLVIDALQKKKKRKAQVQSRDQRPD